MSALADVFTGIAKKQAHVPFRNSKLTQLLQPCLSGHGKAFVLFALSPDAASAQESLCTLRFSSLISQCELGKPTKMLSSESASGDDAPSLKRSSSNGSAADAKKRKV